MNESMYTITASMIEILGVNGILSILDNRYLNILKILVVSVIMTAITFITFLNDIDINAGISGICIMLVVYLCYRGSILDVIFDSIGGMATYVLFEIIIDFFLILIFPTYLQSYMYVIIMLSTLTAITYMFSIFAKCKTKIQRYYSKYKKAVQVIFFNLFLIQIALTHNWNETNTVDISIFILAIVVVGVNVALAYNIVFGVKQKELISYQESLVEAKEEFISRMAAEQHEFSKHIQAIRSIAETDSLKSVGRIRDYTDELIEKREKEKANAVYVGDGVLSAYLMNKEREGQEKNVELSILIGNSLKSIPCTHRELIEITGNLIDNAFEAAVELPEEKRKVYFEIGEEQGKFLFQTINNLPEDFALEKSQMLKRGFSTKRGKQRGQGLSNIKAIAEKNHGKIQISMNDEIIIIKVLF
ncbi:MAG: GHKL domain-containing protein [Clostridiales bacterium]|nr:GHKL domain-containing protein [Clostridiales bacterium]